MFGIFSILKYVFQNIVLSPFYKSMGFAKSLNVVFIRNVFYSSFMSRHSSFEITIKVFYFKEYRHLEVHLGKKIYCSRRVAKKHFNVYKDFMIHYLYYLYLFFLVTKIPSLGNVWRKCAVGKTPYILLA